MTELTHENNGLWRRNQQPVKTSAQERAEAKKASQADTSAGAYVAPNGKSYFCPAAYYADLYGLEFKIKKN